MRLQCGGKGNRGVFGANVEETINGSLTLKASTMANDVFHELRIARMLRRDVFGDHVWLHHLTRKRQAAAGGRARHAQ